MGVAYPTGLSDRGPKEVLVPVTEREPSGWDRGRRLARPILMVAVIGTLVFIQVRAQLKQYESGFRPMKQEPTRVAFSWDMFAIRIERCAITFSPPLRSRDGERTVRSFSDLSPLIEWNPVYNQTSHYAGFAQRLCSQYSPPDEEIRVRLVCFDPTASRHFYDLRCK